jgi:hypothetical protein
MALLIFKILGIISIISILYVAGLNAYTTANNIDKDKEAGVYKANIASSVLSFILILPTLVYFTYTFFKTDVLDI